MNGMVFSSPEAGLSAAAGEAGAVVTRLVKLIEGLNGAVQRARLDGLVDEQIVDRLSVLAVAPVAVRAALAADGGGTAMRFLIASLVAVPELRPNDRQRFPVQVTRATGWG